LRQIGYKKSQFCQFQQAFTVIGLAETQTDLLSVSTLEIQNTFTSNQIDSGKLFLGST
jgi:hypothetical protein